VLCVPSLFQRKEHLQRTATALAEATHIVIAGGGPTGVEVAGEILHQFGRKNITIVHPRGRLLEQCPDRTSHKAMTRLVDEFNVDVILNDALLIPADEFQVRCRFARVEDGLGHDTTVSMYANVCLCVCVRVCACACACGHLSRRQDETEHAVLKTRTFKTKKGKSIEADLVMRCYQGIPNTEALQGQFGRHLTEQGKVQVNEFLQIPDAHNIFISGDIIDLPHTGSWANLEAVPAVIAKNLEAIVTGNRPSATFDTDQALEWPTVVTIGPTFGLFSDSYGCCVCDYACWASSVKKGHQTTMPPDRKP
jgi:NADH dehydrogenase FAD-containing subunit